MHREATKLVENKTNKWDISYLSSEKTKNSLFVNSYICLAFALSYDLESRHLSSCAAENF